MSLPARGSGLTFAFFLALAGSQSGARTSTAQSAGAFAFPVASATTPSEQRLSDRLMLRILRWPDRHGNVAGWEISVEDDRPRSSGNLLYHSRLWHGAYPTQITPDSLDPRSFGSVRRLPVHGRPWEVEIVCADCRSEGEGAEARFVSGMVRVSWRRR